MQDIGAAVQAAERGALVRRAAARLCARMGWAPLHEVPLPNGRRADILALRPDGGFACIEVKSCARDFLIDRKWPEYRHFCDALFFAIDTGFPAALVPEDTGLIIAAGFEADLLRDAPAHRLPRRAAAPCCTASQPSPPPASQRPKTRPVSPRSAPRCGRSDAKRGV